MRIIWDCDCVSIQGLKIVSDRDRLYRRYREFTVYLLLYKSKYDILTLFHR
jgi:hypothetical protein